MKVLSISIFMISFMYSSNVFAGKCWAKFLIKNNTPKEIKALKVQYEYNGYWYTERITKKIKPGKVRVTRSQKLQVKDGDEITNMKLHFKFALFSHRIGTTWSPQDTSEFNHSDISGPCLDGKKYYIEVKEEDFY